MSTETFSLSADHLKLLRAANVRWEDCEYGAPAIDCKRPYGNSSVESDIAEILGVTPEDTYDGEPALSESQCDKLRKIHEGTETALQIVLATGKFEPGRYAMTKPYDYRSWQKL